MATQAMTVTAAAELNERQLIVAGQRGDTQTAEALFRRYHSLLLLSASWETPGTPRMLCNMDCFSLPQLKKL
jgi:hypothetical protein